MTATLESIEGRRLVRYLARTAHGGEPEIRSIAMRLIGTRGEADDVPLLLSIADREPAVAGLHEALAALIARDAGALERLRGRLFQVGAPTLRDAVRAIGGSRRSRAAELLVDLLGREPGVDSLILGELARLGAVCDPETARVAALRLRPFLDERQPGLARAAVNALARLGDPDPVEDLIDLLESEDPGLAATAYLGLKLLTGLRLRHAAAPWRAWYAEQVEWADANLDTTLRRLHDPALAPVLEAMRDLQQHPLERHLIADEVALVLSRPEEVLRVHALRTLGHLGSRAPLDELVGALRDESPDVVAEATAALQRLAAEDHGDSPVAWGDALAARR